VSNSASPGRDNRPTPIGTGLTATAGWHDDPVIEIPRAVKSCTRSPVSGCGRARGLADRPHDRSPVARRQYADLRRSLGGLGQEGFQQVRVPAGADEVDAAVVTG
jgi:hypothetical protein